MSNVYEKIANSVLNKRAPAHSDISPSDQDEDFDFSPKESSKKKNPSSEKMIEAMLNRNPTLRGASQIGSNLGIGALNALTDLTYMPATLPKHLFGGEFKNVNLPEGVKNIPRDPELMMFMQNAKHLPEAPPGLGNAAESLLEGLTGEALRPKNKSEESLANAAQTVGSLISPNYSGALSKAASVGSKYVPQGLKALLNNPVKASDEASTLVKDYLKFMSKPLTSGQKISAASGIGASHLAKEELGDDTFLKRLAATAIGGATPFVAQKLPNKLGARKLQKEADSGLYNKDLIDLYNKAEMNPEIGMIVNENHPEAGAVRNLGQNVFEQKNAGQGLWENRVKMTDQQLDQLGLKDKTRLNPENAGSIIRKGLSNRFTKFVDKLKELKEKAYGHKHNVSDFYKEKMKSSAGLPEEEYNTLINKFFKEADPDQKAKFSKSEWKQRYNILDDFLNEYSYIKTNQAGDPLNIPGTNTPEVFKIKLNRDSPSDTSVYKDSVIPDHTLKLLREEMGDYFVNTGRASEKIPAAAQRLFDKIQTTEGWLPVNQLLNYVEKINAKHNPKWWDAARKDLDTYLENVEKSGASPTALADSKRYRQHVHEYHKETTKDLHEAINEKVLKKGLKESEANRNAFDLLINDISKDADLTKRFLKEISSDEAKTVWGEMAGEHAWVSNVKNTGPNLQRWNKEYSNLTVPQEKIYQEVYKKAYPDAILSLGDIGKLIESSHSVYKEANLSGSSQGVLRKGELFIGIPNAIVDTVASAATGGKSSIIKATKSVIKMFWPRIFGKAITENYLLRPDFQKWVVKGTEIEKPQQFRSWIHNAPNIKDFPKEELRKYLAIFNSQLEKNRKKRK